MTTHFSKPGLLWLFFSFKGRIARLSFALSALFQLVLLTLIVYQSVQAGENHARLAFAGLLAMAILPLIIWSTAALTVKRLNDLDLPAALAILLFIPAINWLTFLFLILKPSSSKTNRHGPPPFGK